MAPIELISARVSDELACRSKRLLERRHKQARSRDADMRLDTFDFQFNIGCGRAATSMARIISPVGKSIEELIRRPFYGQ